MADRGPRDGGREAEHVAGISRSPGETEAVGARVARSVEPGDVVLVQGELGSGKTTFVRGACRELGVEGPVVSPTFTIGRRYAGRVPVSHLDLYRLASLAAEDPGLLADYLTGDAIAFVEWPAVGELEVTELVDDRAGRVLRVRISHAGGDEREIEID